jgi:hypothetical protein
VAPPSSPATFVGKKIKIETFYTKPLCFFTPILNPELKFRTNLPLGRIGTKCGRTNLSLSRSISLLSFLFRFIFYFVVVLVLSLCVFVLVYVWF